MRKDENGCECPETLGEYRDWCVAIGGESCQAVSFLDGKIGDFYRDEPVLASDSQMRMLLLMMR